MKRVVESAKKFNLEFKKSISSAIVAAFGLIVALAWKDVIQEYLSKITGLSPVEGKVISFLSISVVVALALSLVSLVNYVLGRYIISKNLREKKELEKERKISSGLVLSALHPNSLAFYFFNLGLKKESPWKVIFIPLILIPYGFLLAYLFYQLKPILTKGAETPYILVTVLVIWFIIALILKNKNEI